MKKLFKITSIILIQAFLVMDFAWAGRMDLNKPNQKPGVAVLSAQVNINAVQFQNIFSTFFPDSEPSLSSLDTVNALTSYKALKNRLEKLFEKSVNFREGRKTYGGSMLNIYLKGFYRVIKEIIRKLTGQTFDPQRRKVVGLIFSFLLCSACVLNQKHFSDMSIDKEKTNDELREKVVFSLLKLARIFKQVDAQAQGSGWVLHNSLIDFLVFPGFWEMVLGSDNAINKKAAELCAKSVREVSKIFEQKYPNKRIFDYEFLHVVIACINKEDWQDLLEKFINKEKVDLQEKEKLIPEKKKLTEKVNKYPLVKMPWEIYLEIRIVDNIEKMANMLKNYELKNQETTPMDNIIPILGTIDFWGMVIGQEEHPDFDEIASQIFLREFFIVFEEINQYYSNDFLFNFQLLKVIAASINGNDWKSLLKSFIEHNKGLIPKKKPVLKENQPLPEKKKLSPEEREKQRRQDEGRKMFAALMGVTAIKPIAPIYKGTSVKAEKKSLPENSGNKKRKSPGFHEKPSVILNFSPESKRLLEISIMKQVIEQAI